jgi:hypothetical protein
MEVDKVKEIMSKMGAMINSGQPMFSVEYLKKMLGMKKNDLRMNKINKMFDE